MSFTDVRVPAEDGTRHFPNRSQMGHRFSEPPSAEFHSNLLTFYNFLVETGQQYRTLHVKTHAGFCARM
jgi:hypothetical protein